MAEYKLNKELRIAISGKSGCGNTTVSTLLAETLGIKLINYTFRQLAQEKGMTLAEVIEKAKTDKKRILRTRKPSRNMDAKRSRY